MSIRHTIPGIWLFKKNWPWKSKFKVIDQLYRLTSLLLHENQTSNSWHTLFQNLTLKIQGQGHGWGKMSRSHKQPSIHSMYRQVSNIRHTESQHLKDSRTVLRLSLPNPLLGRERRCSWGSVDRRCSNYIWVIKNFIANKGEAYIRGFTVVPFSRSISPTNPMIWPIVFFGKYIFKKHSSKKNYNRIPPKLSQVRSMAIRT